MALPTLSRSPSVIRSAIHSIQPSLVKGGSLTSVLTARAWAASRALSRRTARGDSGDDLLDMDIYNLSGTLMAVAHRALESDPRPRVRDGMLAGVVRDELGVESVALYL